MATRGEFLERIRREVRRAPGLFPASAAERPPRPGEAAAAARRQMAERWPEALERFAQEFERVNGVFHRVAGLDEGARGVPHHPPPKGPPGPGPRRTSRRIFSRNSPRVAIG